MTTSESASPGGLSLLNGTMPEWSQRAERMPALEFVDSCLRGVGQVCFMNNPITGLAILVAMFVGEAWLGFAGALGLVVSTLAAIVIGMDRGAIRAGLFGFNGVLVGAGLSLFLQPDWDVLVMVWIVRRRVLLDDPARRAGQRVPRRVGGAAVHAGVQLHHADLPHRRAELRQRPRRRPDRARRRPGHRRGGQQHAALGADAASANNVEGVLNAIFRGISQLFFANSVVAGIIIIVGHRRVLADRGDLRARRLDGRHAHRARARRQRRRDLQRPVGVQLLRRGAGGRRRVLRAHVGVGPARGRLRGARGDAVRGDRVAVHAVGAAGPDAAVRLRDAGLRAAEGHERQADPGRGRGHHHAGGAPRAPAGEHSEGVGRDAVREFPESEPRTAIS